MRIYETRILICEKKLSPINNFKKPSLQCARMNFYTHAHNNVEL